LLIRVKTANTSILINLYVAQKIIKVNRAAIRSTAFETFVPQRQRLRDLNSIFSNSDFKISTARIDASDFDTHRGAGECTDTFRLPNVPRELFSDRRERIGRMIPFGALRIATIAMSHPRRINRGVLIPTA
jgi:hypothetical protein